jgi:8-oxo-dGTP diphosphatase
VSDRLYPARPILAASVAMFRDGQVLLAARTQPPAAALYSLPGGLVEVGETLEQAALRELMEEVGVEAEIVGFAGHSEIIERDGEGRIKRHFVINAYAARWVRGEAQTGPEAGAVAWVNPVSLGGLATTKGLIRTIEKAVRVIEHASAVTPQAATPR